MRKLRRIITIVVFVLMFLYGSCGGNTLSNEMRNGTTVYAQSSAATYSAKVLDEADLLTADQERQLLDEMQPITSYGNALFVSSDQVNGTTGEYAKSRYMNTFGEQSGIIFLIDMTNRELYIYSHNEMFRIITRNNAYTITDNVYTYATNGDYYTCASMVFSQVEALLKGEEINRPMKHASNLLLAVIFSILLNYWLMCKTSKVKELDMENLLRGSESRFHMEEPKFILAQQKRVRMSSGGGGGSHGGGSSGGGGGGGGHSF
ncbi:MAG: TPM domain-containing protein [Lachnospiraceae bacterium]|nr:TPM domain-containing protein [Lachnospiraceae bacterium]